MEQVKFRRVDGWLPRVIRQDGGELHLEVVGGADALHDPRVFSIPITESHVAVLRTDLARHLILSSALLPLCQDAGLSGPIDETAAVAFIQTILHGSADEVDSTLSHSRWDRGHLVAHGADLALLNRGRVFAAMADAQETANWTRAQEDDANRRRAKRGVSLAPLDEAILKFTGQFLHGSTLPHRNPEAVDPEHRPEVLRVLAIAEQARRGMRISRDPRRGARGTDKGDWARMETAVATALKRAHPELAADAVRTLSFLMCSEAAHAARDRIYDDDLNQDPEAASVIPIAARVPDRVLAMSDDQEHIRSWNPGDSELAAEIFWGFVAERFGSNNEVFTLEDEAAGDGIQLMFYADSIARVMTVKASTESSEPEYRVDYGLLDDLAHYRLAVRQYIAGGFSGLDGVCRWLSDADALEAARRERKEAV